MSPGYSIKICSDLKRSVRR